MTHILLLLVAGLFHLYLVFRWRKAFVERIKAEQLEAGYRRYLSSLNKEVIHD